MITHSTLNGHPVIWLENEWLKLAVLPEKGADIPLLYHQPSGVQVLMETPKGLQPPSNQPPVDFLENYEGGWQELFPNGNDACVVHGVEIPFHGETALLKWDVDVINETSLHLWCTCRNTPFKLERFIHLNQSTLEFDGKVTNLSDETWPFCWGQHVVLGGDFLEQGCQLEIPASFIATPADLYEPATARLAENQWESWPLARGRQAGKMIDLRHIPAADAHCHDDTYLTGFEQGAWRVTNPRLGLRVGFDWDKDVFPWVVLWMPYGGADLPPLTGVYGVGIEPWVSRYHLSKAVEVGEARWLAGGESFHTSWQVRIDKV